MAIWFVAGTVGVNPVSNTQTGNGTLRAHARISGLLMATLKSWCETDPSRRDKRPLTKHNGSREFGTLLDGLLDLDALSNGCCKGTFWLLENGRWAVSPLVLIDSCLGI